jgi:hypothetical protein
VAAAGASGQDTVDPERIPALAGWAVGSADFAATVGQVGQPGSVGAPAPAAEGGLPTPSAETALTATDAVAVAVVAVVAGGGLVWGQVLARPGQEEKVAVRAAARAAWVLHVIVALAEVQAALVAVPVLVAGFVLVTHAEVIAASPVDQLRQIDWTRSKTLHLPLPAGWPWRQ